MHSASPASHGPELPKERRYRRREANPHFFRDSHGAEVGLAVGQVSRSLPVEIESAKTFSAHSLEGLTRFGELVGERVQDGVLVSDGEDRGTMRGVRPTRFDQIGSLP